VLTRAGNFYLPEDTVSSPATSLRMQEYWKRCDCLAQFLGIPKQTVHRHYRKLKANVDFDKLYAGDLPSKEAALKIIEAQPQMRLFSDAADPDPPSDARDLSLAFWFLKKIADVDRAERVM
jgi:hypothetical protein